MMASPLELSFDSKPDQFCSMLLKSVGEHTTEKTQKLEEFLARLEEERVKIDAFKRELPLCMQLLNNAMEASRQQLHSQKMNQVSSSIPVLEEFIPMKNTTTSCEAHIADNIAATDKANWMTSAQLWNQENHETITNQETDIKLGLNGKQMINGGGGAFFPFSSKDRNLSFPDLALASSHKHEVDDHNNNNNSLEKRENNSCKNGNGSVIEKDQQQFGGSANTSSSQTQRKARRCWSPDLHRRFVNALHMLGGSQVATPKQIRELMKVDGLTNDEVKSHLQKYRLHTRRPSPSPQTALTAGPQVVVLGGIWLPPEYAAAAAQGGAQAAAYAAATHHMSHPYSSGGPSMPQEMYQTIAPPQPQQNHHMHQHIQAYNRALLEKRNSFSGSDIPRGTGDPSESIDDDKSESGSWKADSGGENGGERKRVDGEESNASTVVSLKF